MQSVRCCDKDYIMWQTSQELRTPILIYLLSLYSFTVIRLEHVCTHGLDFEGDKSWQKKKEDKRYFL